MVAKLLLFSFFAFIILLNESNANPVIKNGKVATEFLILHNNDMHARFEQTSVNSGKCTEKEANSNRCYGGFARVAHEVRKYREEAKNGGLPVFYLNAGDTYTGTAWFTIFKDKIASEFLNKLQPDAISLGNHEFDESVAGLVPFLNDVDFPVLTCNLDLRNAPEIARSKRFANSTVLEINGVKIGVIGYLTPETKFLVLPNHVEFKEEIECINEVAAKMKESDINIIIALGHSGYQKDQEIAAKCPEVDIVIGGHTNTFLYSGQQLDAERIEGPYPTIVKQKSGKEVPVVQAYAYTKYLGKLHVQFDKDGNLVEFDGTPILLNASIPSDDDVLALFEKYRPNITALETSVVGYTKVNLEGKASVCRKEECNLGNFITDCMIYARVMENQGGQYWTDAAIAVIMGGGIRNSIGKRSDGSVTENDILTVLPFDNDLFVTQITGKTLRNALEHAATIRNRDSNGGFLQVSGIHTLYDYSKKEGERVTSVEVRCAECEVPLYEPLKNDKLYKVVIPEFLLTGGDEHIFIEKNGTAAIRLQKNDKDAFAQFLSHRSIIYPEIEGRITIRNGAAAIASSLLMILSGFFIIKYLNYNEFNDIFF